MTNEQMRTHWTSGATDWVANEKVFDVLFAPVTTALLGAARLGADVRALDVGCGSGTLLAAGQRRGAHMTGIDIAPGMIEAARQRAPAADLIVGDAQSDDLRAALGAPYHRVISRFGVMFFADPVAAFTNLARASTPNASLAFACWRTREENPMFTLGQDVLTARLDPTPVPGPDDPGPTSLADPVKIETVLRDAGWTAVGIDAFDFECDYGFDGTDGVEERLATILGTTTGRDARDRLEHTLGADGWQALLDEVRAELRRRRCNGVVRFPAATWLVTARRN